jgi:hypothetical protein
VVLVLYITALKKDEPFGMQGIRFCRKKKVLRRRAPLSVYFITKLSKVLQSWHRLSKQGAVKGGACVYFLFWLKVVLNQARLARVESAEISKLCFDNTEECMH